MSGECYAEVLVDMLRDYLEASTMTCRGRKLVITVGDESLDPLEIMMVIDHLIGRASKTQCQPTGELNELVNRFAERLAR